VHRFASFWLAVASVAIMTPAAAQLPTRKYLPTGIATEMAVAAVEACRDKGEWVAAAVADVTGDPLAIVRNDRARGQTTELARNWARQGAHQMPPPRIQPVPRPPALNPSAPEEQRRAAEEALKRAQEMQRRNEAQQRRQYGQAILVDGALIGVIAVAGAEDPQADLACAAAGMEKVGDKLK
jgi:uncharacterized protein GlcG (DUF336 family)